MLAGLVGAPVAAAAALNLGRSPPEDWALARSAVIASYLLVGSYIWWRRPTSGLGPAVVVVGVLCAVAGMTVDDGGVAHTIGRATLAVLLVALAYVVLCYPDDTFHSPRARQFALTFALGTAVLWVLALMVVRRLPAGSSLYDCGDACPENAFRVVTAPEALSSGIGHTIVGATAAALLALVVLLYGRARSATGMRRTVLVPLVVGAAVLAVSDSVYMLFREAGAESTDGLRLAGAAAALAIPAALVVGQVRGRSVANASLAKLVVRLGDEPVSAARVEALLRDAAGDPMLTLALRQPTRAGYVDVRGRPIELPLGRRDVAVTPVKRDGRTAVVLIHDAALDQTSGVAEGLGAAALMFLENAQLVDELRASRARIVASAQRERLQLERSLHDGVQQRLFVMQLKLHAAQEQAADDQHARELHEITDDAATAADQLREIAHALYPTVLRERGLADGLRSYARSAPVPITFEVHGVVRCSPAVEEVVYHSVLEAIRNTAQHAGPGARATVTLERQGDGLLFSVMDDGAGFVPGEPAERGGLVTMRDRLGGIGGVLELESAPGRGTIVRGRVPQCRWGDTGDADGG